MKLLSPKITTFLIIGVCFTMSSCKTTYNVSQRTSDNKPNDNLGFYQFSNEDPLASPFAGKKPSVYGKNGMIAATHPAASQVGVDILKMGGNAIDAAVATQFALAVVHPAAGNIGGGGFLVYRDKDGKSYTLDYREKAP